MADTDKNNDKPIPTPSMVPEPPAETAAREPLSASPDLPMVGSPPLSPGEPDTQPELAPLPLEPLSLESLAPEPVIDAPPSFDQAPPLHPSIITFRMPARLSAMTPRRKRNAILAASVALAAAFGAVVGGVATSSEPPQLEAQARLQSTVQSDRQALQHQIAQLSTEIATLKTTMDTAAKASRAQIAKLNERMTSEKLARDSADVTGSITAPATQPAASTAAAQAQPMLATPLPTPRPGRTIAAANDAARVIVPGWAVRDFRDGYVYVESNGDIFRVSPGAPLPGLGPVQSIKRQDGQWVVVTPKGLIVAARDRRRFESF